MPDSVLGTSSSCKHFAYLSMLCVPVGTCVVTQWNSAAHSQGLRAYLVITDMPVFGQEWRARSKSEFIGLRLKLAWAAGQVRSGSRSHMPAEVTGCLCLQLAVVLN